MKSTLSLSLKIIFASALFSLYSCGNESTDEITSGQDTAATVSKDTDNPAEDFFYSLPSPLVMAKVFKKTINRGLTKWSFVVTITNENESYEKTEVFNLKTYLIS